jgi:hypothetical protein
MLIFSNTGDPFRGNNRINAIISIEMKAAFPKDGAKLLNFNIVNFKNFLLNLRYNFY